MKVLKIQIKVKPGSKIEKHFFDEQDILNLAIKERPVDGKANQDVIKTFCRIFSISRSSVEIKSGLKSRLKTLLIQGESEMIRQLEVKLSEVKGKLNAK